MNLFSPIALLGAAGLVALSLPAHAVGSATIADAPLVKSEAMQQLAQRVDNPNPAFFKKSKKPKTKKPKK
jgi:hypothetical protein